MEMNERDKAAEILADAMKVHAIAFGGDAYWMALRCRNQHVSSSKRCNFARCVFVEFVCVVLVFPFVRYKRELLEATLLPRSAAITWGLISSATEKFQRFD